MNFFSKTRVLVTIIVVLAALNLAVIGTVGYHFMKFRNMEKDENSPREHPGKFMSKQMHLNPEQMKFLDNSREEFMKESGCVMKEIRKTSKLIFDEIASENPDTVKLNEYAKKFGQLQQQQKQMMTNHLLGIKKGCTPEQQKYFRKLLHRMSEEENMRRSRNKGRIENGNN